MTGQWKYWTGDDILLDKDAVKSTNDDHTYSPPLKNDENKDIEISDEKAAVHWMRRLQDHIVSNLTC